MTLSMYTQYSYKKHTLLKHQLSTTDMNATLPALIQHCKPKLRVSMGQTQHQRYHL